MIDYLNRHKQVWLHHERVYRGVYADKPQGGDLYKYLRIASKPYRKRYGHSDCRGRIRNRVSMDERPAVVAQRTRIGDWEGDTVMGKAHKSALLRMVERKRLYTVLVRLTGKRADLLAKAAVKHRAGIRSKVNTITLDNGLGFAEQATIAKGLNADIYFAHPYASWERGINENANGLLCEYFPKGTDFKQVTDTQVPWVMAKLNNRPRKTRACQSPNELFRGQRVDLLAA